MFTRDSEMDLIFLESDFSFGQKAKEAFVILAEMSVVSEAEKLMGQEDLS